MMEEYSETIVITDAAGNIIYVNPDFERSTGLRRTEWIGKNARYLANQGMETELFGPISDAVAGGVGMTGCRYRPGKDGGQCREELSIAVLLDEKNSVAHYVAIKSRIGHPS